MAHTPMAGPLVSVVIPVFNGERFLGEALASTFAQPYRPIEVIVVDDGSTDGTATVARRVPDVRYLRQEHLGPSAARNAGVSAATGSILAFLDADDLMTPAKLERQVGHLLANPDVDCVLGRQEVFAEPGAPTPAWSTSDQIPLMSMVVRREVFDRVGAFDARFRRGEDSDWLLRVEESGTQVAVIDDVVLRRRVHGANLTGDDDAAPDALLDVLHARMRRLRQSRGTTTPAD